MVCPDPRSPAILPRTNPPELIRSGQESSDQITFDDSQETSSESLRVLHIIESLSRGGAERRLVNDLTYLLNEGIENRVAHVLPADDLRLEIEALGVPVEWLGISGPRQLPTGILRLRKVIRSFRPDVVHAQLFLADVCTRLAALLAGRVPVITSIQNTMYEPECARFYDSTWRLRIDRFTATRMCCHAVAVSDYTAQSAMTRLGFRAEQISLIHNSVDTARFSSADAESKRAARNELGAEAGDFVLVSAARLVPPKGFPVLVRAMAPLLREVPNARLFLAGKGPDEGELRNLARSLNLGDRVVFLGVRDDLHRVFLGSDIFLFGSLACEGFPLAPLEVMALEIPVVASRNRPMEEIIEDGVTGVLFPPGDPEALARSVARLAREESLRKSIAEAGRRRVHESFGEESLRKSIAEAGRRRVHESFGAQQSARRLAETYRRVHNRYAKRG
jgi:glycosyltransferase involved in cell wall biosynthesis